MARHALAIASSAQLGDHPECAVAHLTLANVLLDDGQRAPAAAALQRASDLVDRVAYVPRETMLAATRERFHAARALDRSTARPANS